MPPANVLTMQKELAYLPAWYANEDDFILTEYNIPGSFTEYIRKNLINPALYITISNIEKQKENLSGQKVCLWGISPQAIHFFETIDNRFFLNLDIPEWKNELIELNSRETSRDCLIHIISNSDNFTDNIIPEFYSSTDEIERKIEAEKSEFFLVKAPFSSSGRGLLWLPQGKLTKTEKQIIHGLLKKQEIVSLEKKLNKKLDFALEFFSTGEKIIFEGFSFFKTDEKGNYKGNFIGNKNSIIINISNYIDLMLIEEAKKAVISYLNEKIKPFYKGYIGIDMMIYEDKGNFRLHPCVEINLRNNMGVVALNISRKIIDNGSEGYLYIDFSSKAGETYRKHLELKENYPPVFYNNKIRSGYLALCPVSENNKYHAYIMVSSGEER